MFRAKVCSSGILFDLSLVPHERCAPNLSARQPMQHAFSCLVFILNLSCVFRFPPANVFIMTQSLDRLRTEAEEPYPPIRPLVTPRQRHTWEI